MTTDVISVHDAQMPELDPEDQPTDHESAIARTLQLATESWIARQPLGYVVLGHDDVVAILRDKRWHSAASRLPELMGITDPEFAESQQVSILAAEGDTHVRLRRLVAKSFSPRSADHLRPFMREVVNGLVEEVAPAGWADIVADICDPYPIPIICELLGAPKEDWQLFSRWAEDVLRIFNTTALEEFDLIKLAQTELGEYSRELIAARRDDPRDDLITALIAAEEEGDRLSTDELVMMVNAVIVGGTDTTRNQLGCAVGLLSNYPEQWRMLAERPDLVPDAIEEVMRYMGAVRGTGRFASEDILYRDVLFPAGTMVFPSLVAANFDEQVAVHPEIFDITRRPVTGQPHMSFGSGIHYCLGASLARAELQEALPILARRMPDLTVDGAIEWKPPSTAIFGPARLPVTFTPNVP